MSEDPTGKTAKKRPDAGRIALLGAAATVFGTINVLSNGSEAPSQAVLILQYAGLAGGVVALIGGLIMMLQQAGSK